MLREILARLGIGGGPRDPQTIAAHESGLRRMMADAHGTPYAALETLEDARGTPGAAVVMEGDWGGQIYLTAPAEHVRCSEQGLRELLHWLDSVAWPYNDGGCSLLYEIQPVGSVVAGGMGGGEVVDGVWLHDEFEELGVAEAVREYVRGEREDLPPRPRRDE